MLKKKVIIVICLSPILLSHQFALGEYIVAGLNIENEELKDSAATPLGCKKVDRSNFHQRKRAFHSSPESEEVSFVKSITKMLNPRGFSLSGVREASCLNQPKSENNTDSSTSPRKAAFTSFMSLTEDLLTKNHQFNLNQFFMDPDRTLNIDKDFVGFGYAKKDMSRHEQNVKSVSADIAQTIQELDTAKSSIASVESQEEEILSDSVLITGQARGQLEGQYKALARAKEKTADRHTLDHLLPHQNKKAARTFALAWGGVGLGAASVALAGVGALGLLTGPPGWAAFGIMTLLAAGSLGANFVASKMNQLDTIKRFDLSKHYQSRPEIEYSQFLERSDEQTDKENKQFTNIDMPLAFIDGGLGAASNAIPDLSALGGGLLSAGSGAIGLYSMGTNLKALHNLHQYGTEFDSKSTIEDVRLLLQLEQNLKKLYFLILENKAQQFMKLLEFGANVSTDPALSDDDKDKILERLNSLCESVIGNSVSKKGIYSILLEKGVQSFDKIISEFDRQITRIDRENQKKRD
ncbi:hypothetical protein EBS43_10035 [bacterium]|nr:hypothetical protein [bacterium]